MNGIFRAGLALSMHIARFLARAGARADVSLLYAVDENCHFRNVISRNDKRNGIF